MQHMYYPPDAIHINTGQQAIFCATCPLATMLALTMIAIGWVAYRPQIGGILLGVAGLFLCGFIIMMVAQKKSQRTSDSRGAIKYQPVQDQDIMYDEL